MQRTPAALPATGPAFSIRTPRLLVRCWEADHADARRLQRAIEESLDHLRPWMPWAQNEPEGVDAKLERIASNRRNFEAGRELVYGIFERGAQGSGAQDDGKRVLGGCGLHDRIGRGGLEIGYWIHAGALRRGYASEMSAALTRVGFVLHALERIEIHCDPRNLASAGVPRKLGYRLRETRVADEVDSEGRARDTEVWELRRDDFAGTWAAGVALEARDAKGGLLLRHPEVR